MGLASVELVMEFEYEFGIKIPDADAERMSTIGSVVRYIAWRKSLRVPQAFAAPDKNSRCVTASEFYALRRILTREFAIARTAVTPDMPIMSLVGRPDHTAVRTRLVGLGVRPAILQSREPGPVLWGLLLAATMIVGLAAVPVVMPSPLFAILLLIAVTGTAIGALLLRRRLADCPATIRDIVKSLAEPKLHAIAEHDAIRHERAVRDFSASREELPVIEDIRQRVCTIVSEQLGVDRARLSDETHFVRDLEID